MATRRAFLAGAAALTATAAPPPTLALARLPAERRFVFILLRGGMDGLAAAPPVGDPDYLAQRGVLALGAGARALNGRFALHPAMAEAHALYRAGELLVVHAAAPPHRTRSHFDAQNILENGGAHAHSRKDGWLNRAIAAAGGAPETGLAIAPSLPLAMRGPAKVGSWAPRLAPALPETLLDRAAEMYAGDPVLADALARGLATRNAAADMTGGARGLRAIALTENAALAASLLARPDGPRVAMLEGGQWDTHAAQGVETGRLARLLGDLSGALAALKTGLGPAWRETVVVAATEFGRTVRPNGARGTDHGLGSAAFLAGGAVAGGQVIADWPGLAPAALFEGRDLPATTDLRSVLKGVLGPHLRLADATLLGEVFPQSQEARPLADILRS